MVSIFCIHKITWSPLKVHSIYSWDIDVHLGVAFSLIVSIYAREYCDSLIITLIVPNCINWFIVFVFPICHFYIKFLFPPFSCKSVILDLVLFKGKSQCLDSEKFTLTYYTVRLHGRNKVIKCSWCWTFCGVAPQGRLALGRIKRTADVPMYKNMGTCRMWRFWGFHVTLTIFQSYSDLEAGDNI